MVLHLVQVALLGGEHGVDLQEQRLGVTAGHPGDGTGLKRPGTTASPASRSCWVIKMNEDTGRGENRRVQEAMLLQARALKA